MTYLPSPPVRCMALSVDIGAGHRRAAEALCQAIERLRPGSQYQIVEALDHLGPGAGKLAKDLYFGVIEDVPKLWGQLYKQRKLVNMFKPVTQFLDDLRSFSLTPIVKEFRPDVILAMHPFACGLAGALGRGAVANCPMVAVLTDFDGHPAWIAKGIDLYIVPMTSVAHDLQRQGLDEEKIAVTGLPLRAAFETIRDQEPDHESPGGQKGVFTVLLVGGGLGLGPIQETAERLMSLEGPVRIVVIAGKNQELKQSMDKLAQRSPLPLHVKGLVENMWDYMRVAHVMISKPGGATCAEAMAAGLPLIALAPIPGQEQANSDALVQAGAALPAPSAQDAYTAVMRMLLSPQLRHDMTQAALRLGRPSAARQAAQRILNLL